MKRMHAWLVAGLVVVASMARGENWAQWRGPDFNGSTSEKNLPTEWKLPGDALWTADLPSPGSATPIVWNDRVFLTVADKADKQVQALCLNAATGKVLWKQGLAPDRATPGGNDMASPSPVTDGTHVWYLTGNGQLACFAMDGQPAWKRDLAADYGEFVVFYGYSSSPLLYNGKLYVLALQHDKPEAYHQNAGRAGPLDSYLLALDPATGKTLWKQERATDATSQSRESYITPVPVKVKDRTEIILAGGECVTGHDAETGKELWRWWFSPADRQALQHNVPTPVAGEDLIYVVRAEHRPLFALRTGGQGKLADDQVAWKFEGNRCWIASPLLYQGRLYVLQEEEKAMVCLDPKTGRVIWEHKLPSAGAFQASPTGADGKIYCISLSGDVVVLAAGDEYRELAHMQLNEKPCRATISAAGGRLFVRTATRLYAIGAKP